MNITEWLNCYPSNWKGTIVTEAMAHPAKYSSKLIRRIYEHLFDMGWVKPGDQVLDPFGGVALGALDAMRLGLHWTGCELESKFAGLGTLNIIQWNNKYGDMPRWGSARLFNGDSRQLLKVIGNVQVSVSSPPYAESIQTNEKGSGIDYSKSKTGGKGRTAGREAIATGYGRSPGQLGAMKAEGFDVAIASPPYSDVMKRNRSTEGFYLDPSNDTHRRPNSGNNVQDGYGNSDDQLSAMPAKNFDISISSPPFLQSEGGTPEPKPGGAIDDRLYARHAAGNKSSHAYGQSDGQLSDMKDGGFELSISSPPYNETDQNYKEGWKRFHDGHAPLNKNDIQREAEYGSTDGQLANADDFWLAARTIVEQVYLALAPGGHACWVVKDYVKNKKIVPFCDQWRQLCEAVGFVTLHEHHAMLVHHKGTQHTLDGGVVEKKTESKSFFRRLAEKNGSPRIDYEVVFCMVKAG